ncbi:uncharacterized membrane protein YtjA (UPF0391 family) [Arthrobacter globiformis]|nr:uncharacterized membrane protein YtjA (UPF0391 family) [Arthrobacter globiformis]
MEDACKHLARCRGGRSCLGPACWRVDADGADNWSTCRPLFHNSQGTFTVGSFGFTAAAAGRAELIYFLAVVLTVLATVVLDRRAWRKAPRSATAVGRFPLGMRPM